MFEVDALLERAAEAAETDDYGDPSFRDGLAHFVESLNHEARLSQLGSVMAESFLISTLTNRLRVEAWRAAHPEVAPSGSRHRSWSSGCRGQGPPCSAIFSARTMACGPCCGGKPGVGAASRIRNLRNRSALSHGHRDGRRERHGAARIQGHPPRSARRPVECNTLLAHAFNSTVLLPSISYPAISVGSCLPTRVRRTPIISGRCSCCSPERPVAGISKGHNTDMLWTSSKEGIPARHYRHPSGSGRVYRFDGQPDCFPQ